MSKREKWITRAKRTRFGRMLCRLAGDNAGAVMMEYVVLALLICAAVVGIVLLFGDSIAGMFQSTTATLQGDKGLKKAEQYRTEQQTNNEQNLEKQRESGNTIRGGQGKLEQ